MKMMKMFQKNLVAVLFLAICSNVVAQSKVDPEYVKVTNERAQKIVDDLKLNSPADQLAVRDIIAEQYRSLNKIQDGRDAKIDAVKKSVTDKEKQQKSIEKIKNSADKEILSLHKSYLKKLSKKLTNSQIVQVKDGMTYGVLPITVLGYNDMLPNLTEAQKNIFTMRLLKPENMRWMEVLQKKNMLGLENTKEESTTIFQNKDTI